MSRYSIILFAAVACNGGNPASPSAPSAPGLAGHWCDAVVTCLDVTAAPDGGVSSYQWSGPGCNATGTLTADLMLQPPLSGDCHGIDLAGAQLQPVSTGIALALSDGRIVFLEGTIINE